CRAGYSATQRTAQPAGYPVVEWPLDIKESIHERSATGVRRIRLGNRDVVQCASFGRAGRAVEYRRQSGAGAGQPLWRQAVWRTGVVGRALGRRWTTQARPA